MKYKMSEKFGKSLAIGAICLGLGSTVFMMPAMQIVSKAVDIIVDDDEQIEDDLSNSSRSIKSTMYENYNSSYGMYEESMDDLFFFYCNVGNGSFTSEPVQFDFPGNIKYVVERDGVEVAYKSGDKITALGNYVIRLTAEYEGDTYNATFRFSLKEAVNNNDNTVNDDTKKQFDKVDGDDVADFDISADDLIIDENDDISEDDINRIIEESGANFNMDGISGISEGIPVNIHTGFTRSFEPATMMYSLTLKSGEKIITNIPEGAVINGGVSITVPTGVTATVYKNSEILSADTTLNFTDPGFYKVVFHSETTQFYRFYPNDSDHPFITFRIVGEAVNDMEVFNAPAGCKIKAISGEYNQFRDENGSAEFDYNSFWMNEEGVYIYTIYDESVGASYDVRINRDITPPSGYASLTKSTAALYFESPDIAKIDVFRNGEQVPYEGPNFSGRGDYTLHVYDKAGNMATITFTLADAFNKGTFFTFLISFILIIAAFVYIRLERTYIRTR